MKIKVELSEAEKQRIENVKHVRENHKRACLICGTSVIVLGAIIGVCGMHSIGVVVEAIGLYMVAMV